MNRRKLLAISVLWISTTIAYLVKRPARGEIMVGLGGDIEETTKAASEKLNEGLSAFHLMMAALDRRNPDDAASQRKQAVDALLQAAGKYETATGQAQTRQLNPQPETPQDQAAVGYFWQHVGEFHGTPPYTQRSLLLLAYKLVRSFADNLGREDLKKLIADTRSQLALFDRAVGIQAFLSGATVMLRIG